MRFCLLASIAALALAGCATPLAPDANAPPSGVTVAPEVARGPSTRLGTGPSTSLGTGMVSAADPRAAAAGIEMLRAGGSATDAALAVLLALTVVEPQSSGIGGGGFLVHAEQGHLVQTYDGREEAPAAAGGDWFFRDGRQLSFAEAVPGGKSVGVPGNVRLMALAHRDHGRLAWARLFDPAIRLARDGFVVTPRLYRALDLGRDIAALGDDGRAIYFLPSGDPRPVGSLVRNPALARLLEQLAANGPDSFYVGPNAQAIVAAVRSAPRNPAPISPGDLASYQAKVRPALCGRYRAHRICGMGPPSSGGIAVIAILKQLERFDMATLGPASPTAWHLFAESTRLAFADRDLYVADPDHVAVPADGLIDPAYLAARSALIAPDRVMATVAAGRPSGAPRAALGTQPAEAGTSHFVAVDRDGNVASLTSTIEARFGSGLMVSGYYLNNELTDFSFVPAIDNQWVANRVEGGKRPRSSMAPTIVFGPDGRVRLALGAAGGATIIAQTAKAILGVIDWRLTAQQAIALPLVFAPGDTVLIEAGTRSEKLGEALAALGHKVEQREMQLKANAIERRGTAWIGAADPRSEGVALAQ